jgi:lysozyme family protein
MARRELMDKPSGWRTSRPRAAGLGPAAWALAIAVVAAFALGLHFLYR